MSGIFEKNVEKIYQARRSGEMGPIGERDSGGRWWPDPWEECSCCGWIREPSRAYPNSLRDHCRTRKHIRNLLKKQGMRRINEETRRVAKYQAEGRSRK